MVVVAVPGNGHGRLRGGTSLAGALAMTVVAWRPLVYGDEMRQGRGVMGDGWGSRPRPHEGPNPITTASSSSHHHAGTARHYTGYTTGS